MRPRSRQVSTPPPLVSYAPPPTAGQPAAAPHRPSTAISGAPSASLMRRPQPVEVQVKTVQKRRGCWCVARLRLFRLRRLRTGLYHRVFIVVILPGGDLRRPELFPDQPGAVRRGSRLSAGPNGRKTIKFETDAYNISVETPRSWVLVTTNDQMWTVWRNMLESTLPFREADTEWKDLETLRVWTR